MGHSQEEKARSRERILALAAEQIRHEGLESLSVGKLMKSAGLTHGGFYGHFESRSELLVRALEQALSDGASRFVASGSLGRSRYASVICSYLSRRHRDYQAEACAIAALAGDVARAESDAREAMSSHINDFVVHLQALLGDEDESTALYAVSSMIGALVVSRVLTDPAQSNKLLATARDRLLALDNESSK